MSEVSSAYQEHGRVVQKRRTREALLRAARQILDEGSTPTLEQAAERAQLSRPTAYRYFRSRRDLLVAAHPELAVDSLLPASAPENPVQRLDEVSAELMRLLLQHEHALRAMFRLAAEKSPDSPPAALRSGKRLRWIEDALAPARKSLGHKKFRRLVLQIGATLGIEPLMWLIDVAHVERKEAAEILRTSARELLRAAL